MFKNFNEMMTTSKYTFGNFDNFFVNQFPLVELQCRTDPVFPKYGIIYISLFSQTDMEKLIFYSKLI